MNRSIRKAEAHGNYALACALLIRRDNRRATIHHYRMPLYVAAWMPAIALWSYLATQLAA